MTSLAELEAAAKEDRIRPVKGLGASLQTKILQNLSIARSGETQLHLHKAAALLEHAVTALKADHPEYSRVEIAGDFRRGRELVSDLAIVAQGKDVAKTGYSSLKLIVSDKKHFGARLLHATGSQEHLDALKTYAEAKRFDLKEDGLYRGRKLMASAREDDIYDALGLQAIAPELREGRGEIGRGEE